MFAELSIYLCFLCRNLFMDDYISSNAHLFMCLSKHHYEFIQSKCREFFLMGIVHCSGPNLDICSLWILKAALITSLICALSSQQLKAPAWRKKNLSAEVHSASTLLIGIKMESWPWFMESHFTCWVITGSFAKWTVTSWFRRKAWLTGSL